MRFHFLFFIPVLALFPQSYEYDAAGRLVRVANPDGTGVAYTYDAADNLLSATSLTLPRPPSGVEVSRAETGTARLQWNAVAGAARYIVFRQRVGTSAWEEIATVTATTFVDSGFDPAGEYRYRVAASNASGVRSANSAEVLPSTNRALHLAISPAGVRVAQTLAEFPQTRSGYAVVDVESGSTPYGTVIFQSVQNGILVSEAAVPSSPPTARGRIFIDYRPGLAAVGNQFGGQFNGVIQVNTGFAIANPGTLAADIRFSLRDAEGRVVAMADGTLPAGAHTAMLISALPGFASGFQIPAGFTMPGFGSLDLESSQDISMMALRITINQRGEALFTSTPVVDLAQDAAAGPVYLPHLADGGGFTTATLLLNTTDAGQTGFIEFFSDDGSPLTVTPVGGSQATRFPYAIAAGGVFVLESDGALAETRAGWIRVTPGAGQGSPVAAGIFRYARLGFLVSEAGIPASQPTTSAIVFVDQTRGRDTGLALANPGGSAVAVRVTARIAAGTVSAPVALPARGHLARLTGDIVGALPSGFSDAVAVSSDSPFLAMTLRIQINARGDLVFSTLPVADQTRPAPSPVVFPHLADGGGFQSDVILLGPISAAQAVVRFYGDDGAPLPIARLP